jgi:hypothetical protein
MYYLDYIYGELDWESSHQGLEIGVMTPGCIRLSLRMATNYCPSTTSTSTASSSSDGTKVKTLTSQLAKSYSSA